MTNAQKRLVEIIRAHGDYAEYWPVVNDWVKDQGPAKALALRNINRTVDALIRGGYITVDEDGLFHIAEAEPEDECPRRLTRQERLEALADSGCDTWEEYREER